MFSVEIHEDGGVTIQGTTRELNDLALHVMRAAAEGEAAPAFVTKGGATNVWILRVADPI